MKGAAKDIWPCERNKELENLGGEDIVRFIKSGRLTWLRQVERIGGRASPKENDARSCGRQKAERETKEEVAAALGGGPEKDAGQKMVGECERKAVLRPSREGAQSLPIRSIYVCSTGNSNLEQYLQPDDVDNGRYDGPAEGNLCTRTCNGSSPLICYYKFNLEHYSTMGYACGNCPQKPSDCKNRFCVTADGIHRNIITVNRRIPGPSIQVCRGDRIIVDVTNSLSGKTATIHWHGMQQRQSPWMDGVYMGSQCSIDSGHTFRYDFVAEQAGTHFWHDHAGLIKEDGVQGPLIVRDIASSVNNGKLYTQDLPSHNIFITDWKHFISDDEFPDMKTFPGGRRIQALLINGKGIVPDANEDSGLPLATFTVQPRESHRFRIISAMCMGCAVELSIDSHQMTLIAVDGNSVEPKDLTSVTLTSGERVDVIVNATQRVGTYWIQLIGAEPCQASRQLAVLRYQGSKDKTPRVQPARQSPTRVTVNYPNFRGLTPVSYPVSELTSTYPQDPRLSFSNQTVTLVVGSRPYTQEEFKNGSSAMFYKPLGVPTRVTINKISGILPPSPLQTQYNDIPEDYFCNDICLQGLADCICVHRIKVKLGSTVTVIIADPGVYSGISHPFHLHGHKFFPLAQGSMARETLSSLLEKLRRITVYRPPAKDTIIVPIGNYAIIRFIADNPGVWIFHCHFIYHNAMGMNVFMQVGEPSDFKKPPRDWPKCGNYIPDIKL